MWTNVEEEIGVPPPPPSHVHVKMFPSSYLLSAAITINGYVSLHFLKCPHNTHFF